MRKILSIMFCLCIAFSVTCMATGCGNDEVLKRIEEIQTQITQLVDRIDELQTAFDSKQTLTEEEEKILKNYHTPTIDDTFEDNKVWVILKSSCNRIIGFKDFDIVEKISGIISISFLFNEFEIINQTSGSPSTSLNPKTITREESTNLALKPLRVGVNSMVLLNLATRDKEKVLAVISQLNKSDIVLVSEPEYIYDAVDD